MDDPAKVVIVLSLFGSAAYTITAIVKATAAHKMEALRRESGSAPSTSEARLARIEQAVEAIALEVERISEGQRFTTKLLSEQARLTPRPMQQQLSANTPT